MARYAHQSLAAVKERAMDALRAAAVWIFGLLAGGIFGAIVGEHLTKTGIGLPLGFMGGVFAFACIRLWRGPRL